MNVYFFLFELLLDYVIVFKVLNTYRDETGGKEDLSFEVATITLATMPGHYPTVVAATWVQRRHSCAYWAMD